MHVYDIEELSKICKKHNCILAIDGTFCSPMFQNPLLLGADVVIHSGTKYLSGHSDTLIGFLCTNNEEIYKSLKNLRDTMGTNVTEDICKREYLSL